MQSATSFLLMAVLLACPHVCRWQAHLASSGAGESQSAPVCPFCCQNCDDRSRAPGQPTDDRVPPTDCICKGAICAAADAMPAIDVEQPTSWLDGFTIAAAAEAASGNHASFDEPAGAPLPLSGRAMRLLMASLRF